MPAMSSTSWIGNSQRQGTSSSIGAVHRPRCNSEQPQNALETEALDLCHSPRERALQPQHCTVPTRSSIMEILYPPSYLNTPSLPEPPAYLIQDPFPLQQTDDGPPPPPLESRRIRCPSPVSQSGVTPADPSEREQLVTSPPPIRERSSPLVGLGIQGLDYDEPLPAYCRYDAGRPRFVKIADDLGPYPHISTLIIEGT